jgi:hypothetical protein
MKSYIELVEKLKKIKKSGFIKTHRKGMGGIGKTLEDLLGIKENNVPGPNAHMIELKSGRKNSKSMLTLFTKSPLPKKANSILLQKFGYVTPKSRDKNELHTTVNAVSFNRLKGKELFKINVKIDRIELVTKDLKVWGFWTKEILKTAFERKLPRLMYVKVASRGKGSNEEFWFNEAWLLSRFNFENFLKLLKDGIILVDIRIGQYSDGRPHDHGTGFRVFPDKLDLCFKDRKRII